ncbi:MAG: hypothetical protein WAJ93_21965 [Candidatus Nitrosopolaris sp.]
MTFLPSTGAGQRNHFRRVKRFKHTAKPDKARVAAALLSSIDNAR